ncbi:MAG: hypothetical protein ACKOIA_01630, partial [Acidimicrobiia bacterium]
SVVWSTYVMRRRDFRQQDPGELLRVAERLLLDVAFGREERVIDSWVRFLEDSDVEAEPHFAQIGPTVRERLAKIGVVDAETARLDGLSRRALYQIALMKADAGTIIELLQIAGIHPILGGDLISSIEADRVGEVRPARSLELLVGPDDVRRVLEVLRAPTLGIPTIEVAELDLDSQQARINLRFRSHQRLMLMWRWLPYRAALAVPLTPTRHVEVFDFEGGQVLALNPTARLVSMLARTRSFAPDRVFATLVSSSELIHRHRGAIDWMEVQEACSALGALPRVAEVFALIPEPLRAEIPIL